jgi:RNA polymerase sigma-70 factor (ECF subfamily)
VKTINRQIEEQLPRLRRYARALTGNSLRADDLIQDTLERAWSKLHLWRPGSDLRAWLFSIMHNLFVNAVRKAHCDTVPLEDEALEVSVGGNEEQGLLMRDLEAALRRIPEEQREVLLLVAIEEVRYEEVARILDIPIGTVMSRLSRARDRLRILMSPGNSAVVRRIK